MAAESDEHGYDYYQVLRKRSIGFARIALNLLEITPFWDHGGKNLYFSVKTRLQALRHNTHLPDSDHFFWIFTATLLVGIYRLGGR